MSSVDYSWMNVVELFGGLGLFLYGMHVLSDAVQRRAGKRMRSIMATLTTNRFAGILTGLGATAIIQSSSATTVLLVSLVNAGLVNLTQAIGVIMGANIGTTLTGWIVSIVGFKFQVSSVALPAIAIGIPLFFSKHKKHREIAGILIGFGITFLGLHIMKEAVPDLRGNPHVLAFLAHFNEDNIFVYPLFILVGALLTIIVQSSSAAMTITLTMAHQGWINFPISAAIVLGENIGTTVTAYLASLGMNIHAKRAARAHLLFNIIGVCWMLPIIKPFLAFVDYIVPGAAADHMHMAVHLAAFHTMFNVLNTGMLIGFVNHIANLTRRWVPDRLAQEPPRLVLVNRQTTEDVESNLISVMAELGRMGEIVYNMSMWELNALQEDKTAIKDTRHRISEFEEMTDTIQQNVNTFLTDCMARGVSEDQANRIRAMYRIAHELEKIGDACKRIIDLLAKRATKDWRFHEAGLEELATYQGYVLDFLKYNCDFLCGKTAGFALETARAMEDNINHHRNKLRKASRKILAAGGDVKGELIFLDLVRHLEQIGDFCYNVSEEIDFIKP
jgi:phosphate:Na+ symporter